MSINPLMLSDGIGDDLLEAEPVELQVSLDGHDDESFEKIRGLPAVYEQSRRNLIRFLEKKAARGKTIHITLSVIDFPLNERSEEDSRAEWERYWRSVPGIDTFLWKGFCSWSGDTPEITDLDRAVHSPEGQLMRRYRAGFKVTCDWPWKRMVVAWNGDVLSCCYDYDAKYVLGNVGRQSLTEIWNGAPMQALRREFASGCVTNSLCANCDYLRA
jgi:radical SAM protein with 4Fe4S-binding SPASM domain